MKNYVRFSTNSLNPLDVFNYLCKNDLSYLYPNTAVAARIQIILPVEVEAIHFKRYLIYESIL